MESLVYMLQTPLHDLIFEQSCELKKMHSHCSHQHSVTKSTLKILSVKLFLNYYYHHHYYYKEMLFLCPVRFGWCDMFLFSFFIFLKYG